LRDLLHGGSRTKSAGGGSEGGRIARFADGGDVQIGQVLGTEVAAADDSPHWDPLSAGPCRDARDDLAVRRLRIQPPLTRDHRRRSHEHRVETQNVEYVIDSGDEASTVNSP
jgi:hypothetical protein